MRVFNTAYIGNGVYDCFRILFMSVIVVLTLYIETKVIGVTPLTERMGIQFIDVYMRRWV